MNLKNDRILPVLAGFLQDPDRKMDFIILYCYYITKYNFT